jgi:hypothetical protein
MIPVADSSSFIGASIIESVQESERPLVSGKTFKTNMKASAANAL